MNRRNFFKGIILAAITPIALRFGAETIREIPFKFEPKIEKKTKSDYVGPQTSQVGGIGGPAASDDEDEEKKAQKTWPKPDDDDEFDNEWIDPMESRDSLDISRPHDKEKMLYSNAIRVASSLSEFMDKHDIKQEKGSIGFSEKEQKYYGWSHRAIYGFGIGDIVKEGDVIAESFSVGFEAKNLDDSKRMAIAFAEGVS